VFGFALASSLSDPTVGYPSWNFSLLSTVAFFGLHINWDGTIVSDQGWSVWNSSSLTGLVTTAHANSTKVVLTIVLQDFQPGTPNMCAGLINRATTVSQTVAQVAAKGVDGVNVDYEGLNGTCQSGQTARAMLTGLVGQLRAALPSSSYLSVDTYASSATDPIGFFDVPSLNASVDSFFVMAYDLEYSNWRRAPLSCSSFCLGPTAPRRGYYYNDTDTASQYTAVVSAAKVILGVPYYGRKSCVSAAAPNQIPSSFVSADSYLDASTESNALEVLSGSYSAHRDANDPDGMERWDTWYNTSLGCTRELYWDDATSLGAKYDLVNAGGLRGVGIWTLNYGGGAPELWAALAGHFERCSSVTVAANPASPARTGTSVSITASASGCPNPLYQFWVLPPGGLWTIAQSYIASGTFNWITTGKPAGTYIFSVWARNAASNAAYDAYNSDLRYVLDSNPCTTSQVSVAPSSPANVGVTVIVTGSATGCPNPQYQFWMLPPAGTWVLAQPYSAVSRFTWSTTAEPVGTYLFSVWVRDSTSTASYDAYNSTQYYTLTRQCTAVTVAFSPGRSAPMGTPVTITGTASDCPKPLYQFWILAPGGAWTLAQSYSANATFVWNTSGQAPGAYLVSVWARDTNSPGTAGTSPYTYDAYNSSNSYTLSTPCSAVNVTAAPASPAAVGTQVTVTASASGCPNPRYQFWVLPPGGPWTLVQSYSTSPTYTWNTAGKAAGTYLFSVWARDASSPGTNGVAPYTYDAYNSSHYYTLGTPCTAVNISAVPASGATIGTQVTVTGSTSGCANPRYEFWVLPPGGYWTLVQSYGSGPTLIWNTSGKPAGTYLFSVWARDASSPGTAGTPPYTYDAFSLFQYTLS
jgi:spore germination protein YaaH